MMKRNDYRDLAVHSFTALTRSVSGRVFWMMIALMSVASVAFAKGPIIDAPHLSVLDLMRLYLGF